MKRLRPPKGALVFVDRDSFACSFSPETDEHFQPFLTEHQRFGIFLNESLKRGEHSIWFRIFTSKNEKLWVSSYDVKVILGARKSEKNNM